MSSSVVSNRVSCRKLSYPQVIGDHAVIGVRRAHLLHELAKPKDLSQWSDDDWLRFAALMIVCVQHARDISAEDATKAISSPPSPLGPSTGCV